MCRLAMRCLRLSNSIILNSVGNRKMKYYQDKLSNVKLSLFHQGQQNGITLAIKF